MSRLDQLQQLDRILKSHRYPVPLAVLAERMECSDRTVRRIIDDLRNFFDAPLEYSPEQNGWHYTNDDALELPGMWLTSAELQSLTLLLHVLENFGNGLLNQELATVEKRIKDLLRARDIHPGAFAERLRVLSLGRKSVPGKIFRQVGDALLQRRQLRITYSSFAQKVTERNISPQTLVYYRDNWYLDAWCHLRKELRTFSLARIVSISVLEQEAMDIPREALEQHYCESYGIFSGQPKHVAILRFSGEISREIAGQEWHPQQQGHWEGNEYVLRLPYSDDRELIGDIQRYMPDVVVEAPTELRDAVLSRLRQALARYPQS